MLSHDPSKQRLDVDMITGWRLVVFPLAEDANGHRVRLYPVRLGYARTVYKMQGATLDHMTLWLDTPGCPAAGYVGLSRAHET